MGREIRRVPPNWEHPRYTADNAPHNRLGSLVGEYIPMFDRDYDTEAREWLDNCVKWDAGEHEDQQRDDPPAYKYFWEWGDNPPDPESHRPAFIEQPTWYQMYQTVSEGTPVTPPFETKAELVNWLVERGESHGTQYEKRYTRGQAEAFVEQEWAPSLVVTPETGAVSGVEYAEQMAKERT